MRVAKVIGNIWATRKEEKLAGLKLLIVQPINIIDGTRERTPIVAADIIGAGVGETVIIVSGSSARSAAGDMGTPVDATVVGIVDDQEIDASLIPGQGIEPRAIQEFLECYNQVRFGLRPLPREQYLKYRRKMRALRIRRA